MIINKNHKFVYIHIPKTGGSTIEDRISGLQGTQYCRPPHGSVKDIDTKGYYVFTTLRNPIDWYVSFYSDKGSTWSHDIYGTTAGCFETWLRGLLRLNMSSDVVFNAAQSITEDALDFKYHLSLYGNRPTIKGAGWLTHLVIFSCCKRYEDLLELGDIELIIHRIEEFLDVDMIIDTSTLDHIAAYITYAPLRQLFTATTPMHSNRSKHKNSADYYSESLMQELLEKEKLVFKLMDTIESVRV